MDLKKSFNFDRPVGVESNGVWKGVMDSCKTGWVDAVDMAPHTELKVDSPLRASRLKISRRGTVMHLFLRYSS